MVGLSNLWVLFWWLHFLARDWNLHIIVSHVVGAIVGSFMGLMLHGMSGFE